MIQLKIKLSIILKPIKPFDFDNSVYNPTHYDTPEAETEAYEKGKFWQTMRFKDKLLGFKFENKGTVDKPKVKLTIYSKNKLDKKLVNEIVDELNYRFEFNKDLSEFCNKFKNDKFLGSVLKKRKGMRNKCGYSLYESLMIYITLQNATVRRTVQMMTNLLKKYGTPVEFDKKKLYVFWNSEKLAKTSEDELRALKVGYRDKMFIRISEAFANKEINELKLRNMPKEDILKEMIKLYGVGKQSASYMLFEVFHDHETLDHMPPWEGKILSKIMFGKFVSEDKLLKEFEKRYDKWKRLAFVYIFADIFWRREYGEKIDWLEKEIRL
ncbi:MAG: hypothetical protein KJ906_00560 [Nanoarchaeota archaeon]|nr:hypothetical protein [Nanoarchaeota archaeon]